MTRGKKMVVMAQKKYNLRSRRAASTQSTTTLVNNKPRYQLINLHTYVNDVTNQGTLVLRSISSDARMFLDHPTRLVARHHNRYYLLETTFRNDFQHNCVGVSGIVAFGKSGGVQPIVDRFSFTNGLKMADVFAIASADHVEKLFPTIVLSPDDSSDMEKAGVSFPL
jgi:hypothetical protein